MKIPKVSKRAKEDFVFYTTNPSRMLSGLGMSGLSQLDLLGQDALTAFFLKDTHGISCPIQWTELKTFDLAISSKKSWNLQIKMWAESLVERTLFAYELIEYTKDCPSWVQDAVWEQAASISMRKEGYVQSWIQCKRDFTTVDPETIRQEIIKEFRKEFLFNRT
jgi:hypothetical protein